MPLTHLNTQANTPANSPVNSRDLERRFHLVEQAIAQAAEASSAEHHLPSELRDAIQRLDRLGDTARDILQAGDHVRIRKLVGDMVTSAERARRVCTNIPQLSAQIRGAVSHLSSQIQELQRDVR
jgi:phage shock protein A